MDAEKIRRLWETLYPGEEKILGELTEYLEAARKKAGERSSKPLDCGGAVYCLYPDAFEGGLDGATARMDYFADLGVKTLWVLPALTSPGRDQGFDICDYRTIDPRFGGNAAFSRFLAAAEARGLQTIFDVAVNHCSDQHPWFQDALARRDSPYRDYFIWSDTDAKYAEAPLVFRGMVNSNWTWADAAGAYYFHRFYPFQPDLNYANPRVIAEMIRILGDWKLAGVGGFRLDAVVMLWKREGTTCENLPEVHRIVKLLRACLDAISPDTLLLAEANQPVPGILQYFGDGDECRAAYHFPLMPRFWQALAEGKPEFLLKADIPPLPASCAWFTFLRVHDEITLDVLPEAERLELVAAMAGKENRLFREGHAFAGRLFDLLGRDADRAVSAFALLLSLPGTPILYYGDEIGMVDNEEYYRKTAAETGFADARFLHRGPYDARRLQTAQGAPDSPEGRVYRGVRELFQLRAAEEDLFRAPPRLSAEGPVLISVREKGGRRLRILSNLSGATAQVEGREIGPYQSKWELLRS